MGIFCLVLHTHLPYLRRNGTWPSGEDFFHQAATESYLPVLGALESLHERGLIRDALTIGLSPMVAHQMADQHMLDELGWYLGRIEVRALQQVANYDGVFAREFKDVAAFYALHAREQGARLDAATSHGGLARAFAALEDAGAIEILGGPATHPYLPLVRERSLAELQVRLGAREHERLLGRAPAGMWLPECAYDPSAGIESMLSNAGVGHIVVDGPTMIRSAGPGSTFAPRRIAGSDVVAFARNLDVTYRVWSPTGGYPSGKWYRDFYHYDMEAGFKDWRVTSIRKPLHEKRPYEREPALAAARADAEDFALLIAQSLRERPDGVVVAAYDTELFGHWWLEGPAFLEHLYEILAEMPDVEPRSLRSALEVLPEPEPVELVAGSWGFRKDERSWVAGETQDMWEAQGEAETETVALLEKFADATGARAEVRDQMLRELLLMQSSDWPFMVIRGRNPDYARERFFAHRGRWRWMADLLTGDQPEETLAAEAHAHFDRDNVLPELR